MERSGLDSLMRWSGVLAVAVFAVGCSGEPAPAATVGEEMTERAPERAMPSPPEASPGVTASTCADASPLPMDGLMGTYTVASVDRYRGGLTTDETAQAWVGSPVVVTGALYRHQGKEIQSPDYELVCHDVALAEGEVPTDAQRLLSTFHGMRSDRSVVWELRVLDPASGEHEAGFEVLVDAGGVELWYLYDGWRMVLRPAAGAATP